jgi:hypothetical protein
MRTVALLAITAGAVVAAAVPAAADPAQEVLPFTCTDGHAILAAVAPANGTFTPNFDTATTVVFKPTTIILTRTVYDAAGTPVSSTSDQHSLGHGNAQRSASDLTMCTASENLDAQEDPRLADGQTETVSAAATGFFTPRH